MTSSWKFPEFQENLPNKERSTALLESSSLSNETDVTNCVPKFGFASMGYLMLPFERTFHKDIKTEKSFEICLSNQKIWRFKVWVFAIFSNKLVENSNF